MKTAIDAGHNAYPDIGAIGLVQEDIWTKELDLNITSKLKTLGYEVVNVTPYGKTFNSVTASLGYRCNVANINNVDLYVTLHFNVTPKATGSEIWIYSKLGEVYSNKVLPEICSAMGYTNRGIKYTGDFVLKYSNAPALLIEECFIDNPNDVAKYNVDKMANAIIKGLTGQTVQSDNKSYRIMTGAFINRDADINYCSYLKSTYNIDAYTVNGTVLSGTPQGTYRVITGTFVGNSANDFANKLKAQGTTVYVVDANVLK
jgi:N-acetylmuramoyl-L-alanine amidase